MNTDVLLGDFVLRGDTLYVSGLKNIHPGHKGYDNQPSFSSNRDRVLFSAQTADSTTNIFYYDVKSGKTMLYANSPQTSEYSPAFYLHEKSVTCVRVEEDQSTQRIWTFSKNGKKEKCLFPEIDSVGYYQLSDNGDLFAFILGKSEFHSLRYYENGKKELIIADSVGRCFFYDEAIEVVDGESIQMAPPCVFFSKYNAKGQLGIYIWYVNDFSGGTHYCLSPFMPEKAMDFISYSNSFICSSPEGFFILDFATGEWNPLILISDVQIKGVTRFKIHAATRKIALVVSE